VITSVIACLGIAVCAFSSLLTFGAAVSEHRRGQPRGLVSRITLGALLLLGTAVCFVLLLVRSDERDGLWATICVLLGLRVAVTWIRIPGERPE